MSTAPTLLVVRPREQARRWVEALAALGVAARSLSLIDIGPAPDARHVEAAFEALRRAAAAPGLSPVVVFVSPNAVGGLFDVLRHASFRAVARAADAATWPADVRACAAGPGTATALVEAGVPAALVTAPAADAPQIDSEALWHEVGGWDWMGRRVWIARGNGGREWLAERLRAAGARVEIVQTYLRIEPVLGEEERAVLAKAIAQPARWIWMFSSSEAIGNLLAVAPAAAWGDARAIASHPRIVERARAAGFGRVDVVAPTVEAVAEAVAETARDGPG